MVRVVFLDAASGAELTRRDLAASRLPVTAGGSTATVELDGERWWVESADAAPDAGGALVVRVRRWADLSRILYPVPTVCEAVPMVDENAPDGDRHVLHEDDWRQVELVGADRVAQADGELAGVRAVLADHVQRGEDGACVGFDAVHVRRGPRRPWPDGVRLHELLDLLGVPSPAGPPLGIAFFGELGAVPGSFAVPVGPGVVYGLAEDDEVLVCGLDVGPRTAEGPGERLAAVLEGVLRAYDLVLVDWCRALTVPAPSVGRYLAHSLPDPS